MRQGVAFDQRRQGRRISAPTQPMPNLGSKDTPEGKLRAVQIRAAIEAFFKEPPVFWFLCFYFFVEYVRPQQVYRSLDLFPWGEVALGLTAVAILFGGFRVGKFTLLDGCMALFSFVLILSSTGAFDPATSFEQWPLFINWIIVYVLVTRVVTTPRRYFLFLSLFLLWSLKMSQHGARTWIMRGGSFASWGATGGAAWFRNSGEFAIQMCIFLPLAVYFIEGLKAHLLKWKYWGLLILLPGTALLSLLASSSRGGQIGGALVILFMVVLQSRKRITRGFTAGVVLAVLWVLLPPVQKERFTSIGEDDTSVRRLTYWRHGWEIWKEHPAFGIGYNNWIPYYRRYYDPLGEVPHNIFIEAGSELGFAGFFALLLLIGAAFFLNRKTRRLSLLSPDWGPFLFAAALGLDAALVGFMASGFFVTVLYYPFLWVNLSMTGALHVSAKGVAHRGRNRLRPGSGGPDRHVTDARNEAPGMPGRAPAGSTVGHGPP